MKALYRSGRFAIENDVVAHGLHAEHADSILEQDGQNFLFKTIEVRVHHVERHLYSVEREAVLGSSGQHFQMDVRALVACEADEADLARLLRLQDSLHPSAYGKNAIRVRVANHFMELE